MSMTMYDILICVYIFIADYSAKRDIIKTESVTEKPSHHKHVR